MSSSHHTNDIQNCLSDILANLEQFANIEFSDDDYVSDIEKSDIDKFDLLGYLESTSGSSLETWDSIKCWFNATIFDWQFFK